MRICLGQVFDVHDFMQRGVFFVYAKEVSENPVEVTYVTPYASQHEAGMVAIPEEGTSVLIVLPENSSKWYYMGATYEPSVQRGTEKILKENQYLPDKNIYRARGRPQKVLLKDTKGNQLTLSSEYNPKFSNIKAELASSKGKKLILSDSPTFDSVLLRNEHRDGLKITATADNVSPARSIELECKGPQKIISRNSEIEIRVNDGREVTIENLSTGIKNDPAFPEQFGNINVISHNKDINLTTKGLTGKIFIDALGPEGHIQIDSAGTVTIWADRAVKIKGATIDIKADQDVNIEAGGSMNIKAGGTLTLQGSQSNIGGDSTVAIEGPSRLDLNRGSRIVAGSANIGTEDKKLNSYGN